MSARIIDGKGIAAGIREQIKSQVQALLAAGKRPPGLTVVLVGDDPSSAAYVRMKGKACAEAGIISETIRLPADTEQAEILAVIEGLNANPNVDGILVQLPLPPQVDELKILKAVNMEKDVDGFNPASVGLLHLGSPNFIPCTPKGILRLLDEMGVEIKGRRVVMMGRSNIVGKPTAALLMGRHGTVTICHSRTTDLPAVCRGADILVVAIGQEELVRGDWVKPGAVVIDVGINAAEKQGEKKLVGDVCFAEAAEVAGWITPVPKGVGPMTIAMLLENTLLAYSRRTDSGAP